MMRHHLLLVAIGVLCMISAALTISLIQDVFNFSLATFVCHLFGLGISFLGIAVFREKLKDEFF